MNRRELLKNGAAAAVAVAVAAHTPDADATFGLLGGAPASSSGSGGFYADPYSSFNSYIADTTFAGTNGASTTVTWGSGTLTAPTYSTLQAAITAGVGPGNRVCVLKGQSWTIPSGGFSIPSTATCSAGSPFVIQGDPGATWSGPLTGPTSTIAQITGGGANPGSAFSLGTSVNNQYVVIRKVEITNLVDSANGVAGISLDNTYGYTGAIIEYCWIHYFRASGAGGESGAIYTPIRGDNTQFTVRNCLLGDVQVYGGGTNDNMSAIGLYGGAISCYNNEIYGATNCVRFKGNPSQTPNQTYVYQNLIHDFYRGVTFDSGGSAPGENGTEIYGNLFCWLNFDNTVFTENSSLPVNGGEDGLTTTTPTGILVYNNTFAPGLGTGLTNNECRSVRFYNNVVLCSNPVSTSYGNYGGSMALCDYNAYFSQTNFSMNASGTSPAPVTISTFSSGAAGNRWTTAHTDYSSYADLSADPDAHGMYIPALTSPYNTIAGNFPNYTNNDYTLDLGSPLATGAQGGGPMGYDSSNCGTGWAS